MEHGAVRVLPKSGHRFIDCNNKDLSTQLSPKLLSRCVLFYLAMHFFYRIEGKRQTALSVCDRSFSSFNATPWLKATLLSRSAIARVASVSSRFRSKEQGTRVKNGPSKRAGMGAPRGTERHSYLGTQLMLLFFPNATAWHNDVTVLALDQNIISSFLSYNHHLIGKEIDSWSSEEYIFYVAGPRPKLTTFQTYEITNLPPSKKNYNNAIVHDARLQKKKKRLARIKANKSRSTCLKHQIKKWFPSIGPKQLNENYNDQQKDQTYMRLLRPMQTPHRKVKIPESFLSSLIHQTWWNFRS